MPQPLWLYTFDNHEYSLVNDDNHFFIYRDGEKYLKHLEFTDKWIGMYDGKIVMVSWLSLKTIINLIRNQEIQIENGLNPELR